MKRRNLIIIAAFAAAIAVVMLLPKAAKGSAGATAGGFGAKGGASGATVFTVKTEEVSKKSLQDYIETNGDVEPTTSVEVYPDVSGKISRIHVALGSRVSRGQLVAEIDPSKPGVRYELSPVYAPISGTITSVPLDAGTTVSTSSAIAQIGATNELQISAKINERDIAVLKTGLKAAVTFDAYPGVKFPASIIRVSPLVDSTSRTKQIYLGFDSADDRIDAGMFAKIKLNTVLYSSVVAIAEDSVVTSFDKTYVYVLKGDSTVEKREVTVGVSVDGQSQILSGLKTGERIVIQGLQLLSDGSHVKDIATAQKAAEEPASGKAGSTSGAKK